MFHFGLRNRTWYGIVNVFQATMSRTSKQQENIDLQSDMSNTNANKIGIIIASEVRKLQAL